ncbi:hypothetical protein XENTR_v10004175 [Xenopus tropicalis]|nr:hypothetical protein XENTR_v10004175 [Xenopus tropicalis]
MQCWLICRIAVCLTLYSVFKLYIVLACWYMPYVAYREQLQQISLSYSLAISIIVPVIQVLFLQYFADFVLQLMNFASSNFARGFYNSSSQALTIYKFPCKEKDFQKKSLYMDVSVAPLEQGSPTFFTCKQHLNVKTCWRAT